MALKTVFFCGHKSRYGQTHLEPILDEFQVAAVVFANDERWAIFEEKLSGKSNEEERTINKLRKRIITNVKKMVSLNKPPSIEKVCRERKIPVLHIFDINEGMFIRKIREYKPDIILCAAYPQIFSKALISVPERGAINFHPSLLPRCRGAHPHFWSLATGEKLGGITAHFMTENIDAGDIIAQREFPIDHYYYGELYNKILDETPSLVNQVRLFLEDGKKHATKQDSTNATYFKNDREIHRRIFWSIMPGQVVYNLIRTEQAFCFFRERKVIVKRAGLIRENRNITNQIKVETGTIIDINESGIVIATTNAYLVIYALSEGGKDFNFHEWAIRNRVLIGEKLS